MKRIITVFPAIIIALILTGCGSSGGDDGGYESGCAGGPYNSEYDQSGVDGLLLIPSNNMFKTFPEIEQIWLETKVCVLGEGIDVTAPVVSYESFSAAGIDAYLGLYGIDPKYGEHVRINTDNVVWIRDCRVDDRNLRHEFVHHLMYVGGLSMEDSATHNSTLFGLPPVGCVTQPPAGTPLVPRTPVG